ncbi:MAG: RluA family pseudouridine synthase [Candidatus Cloacimonetes bacterium]|nr:RluA family pseudouridine synthase [Candidatus Cloacimonadota bacterium]
MKPYLDFSGHFDWIYPESYSQRLDSLLGGLSTVISRTLWVRALNTRKILVNGVPEVKKGRLLRLGDRIQFDFYAMAREILGEELLVKIPWQKLFEDENLVVVNKPSGVLMHRIGFFDFSLVSQVQNDLNQVLHVVHRLDKATSGVCVFAKSAQAAADFQKVMTGGGVHKIYIAASHFLLDKNSGVNDKPIGQDDPRIHSKKQKVDYERGVMARTRYRYIGSRQDIHYYMLRIFTGRQHQIRVHMQSMGAPLVYDELYSYSDYSGFPPMYNYSEDNLGLHAFRLRFVCPFTQKLRIFTALPIRYPFLDMEEAKVHPLREFALHTPPKTVFHWKEQEE